MPVRFLRGNYARLALTVVALACGVGLVCAIDLVNRAVLRAFVEVIDTMAGRAALQVTAGEGGVFGESIATTVSTVSGVELAVPVVSAAAFTADDSAEFITIQGVDIANEQAVRTYDARDEGGVEIDDPLVFLNQTDSIIVTRPFAARRRLAVNDQLALVTPTGRRNFTIRALLQPVGVARVYGGNLAVMDLYAAERMFTQPEMINRIDVVVGRDQSVSHVADAIAAVLPAGLRVEAPAQRKIDLHKVMQSLQVVLQGVGSLGLVAGFLIAFNRLATVFERRAWQLGVMRALGVRQWTLWWELVKESLLLGAAGVVLGIVLGRALARLLLPVIATTTAVAYKLVAPAAEVALTLPSLVLATALGLGAALLAAALPAWRAAQLGVATTMSGRGVEQQNPASRAIWLVRALIVIAVIACALLQSITQSPVWGLLATALIAVATALAARPLLGLTTAVVSPLFRSLGGPSARFAAAALLHNPRRMALTAGTLGVGLGSVLWLWMVARSFEQSVIDSLSGAMRADLAVTSSNIAAGFLEAPVDQQLLADLKGIAGVKAVAGERVIDWHHRDGPIAIDAFDPAYFSDPVFGQLPLLGRHATDVWEAVARGEAVIVSSNFALHLQVDVGDTITLDTPSGALALRVAGITMVFISPRGTIEMSRALFERTWHDTQINHAFVQVAPGTAVAAVRDAIARELGGRYGLRILSCGELIDFFASQVRRAFAAAHVLAAMVLLVVLLGMADTLAANVAERTRELGSIRAIGVRRRHVQRMVLLESVLLGGLGLALAVVAGGALGVLWVDATFPYLLGWTLERHVPYLQAAGVGVTAIAVCLIAALIPARRAGRLEPAAALRYE
jgi:putative ABC transport system permease protein